MVGAYLQVRMVVMALFPDGTATRGEIDMRMPETEGANGMIAQVPILVTGVAAADGFHGIGGHYVRQHPLQFADVGDASVIGFRRHGVRQTVSVELDLRSVSAPPMRALLATAIEPETTPS
ncbi:hypothetical protein [Dyella sp. A6]|uniref:hypothetical protein n=1 Tax=Dyella aluminiiresistens TaxID=3069105 RepID=UPI002E77E955|nr:hypothetical protein [Dyella sp. A6]